MKAYKQALSKLNQEQKQAVETIDGPVLVIAGPGTGKTQLLSLRVASILEKTDTDAGSILCVTFTQKAAMNMRERLNQLIGPDARHVVVKTFHSFAAEIMNEYPDYFWQGARLSVAPDAVQDDIIQNILANLPLDSQLASTFAGTYTALPDVKQGLKLAKEAGITPDELSQIIGENLKYIDDIEPLIVEILSPTLSIKKLDALYESIAKLPEQSSQHSKLLLPLSTVIIESLEAALEADKQSGKTTETGKWKRRWIQTVDGKKGMFTERKRNNWWLELADVYKAYRKQLHTRGYYDYSDMLVEVLDQLQKQPDLRADVQERYLYVQIDEFQDTNAAQLRLAHLVADHHAANHRPNLMAVGDDDQSIFAFNGAELSNILDFKRSYPGARLIVLKKNYRSSQRVLDTARAIIEQADDRLVVREPTLSKDLLAVNETKSISNIKHISYPTRQHQFDGLANTIQGLWYDGERDIAVLARKHDSLKQLASTLLDNNIPVRYDQQSDILEHEAIRLIYDIARSSVAIAKGDSVTANAGIAQLIRHPMWQITPMQLWKLATDNYRSPDWLASLLENPDPKLQALGQWLSWLGRNSQDTPLPLIMEYILGLREGEYMISPFRNYYLSSREIMSEYLETLSAVSILQNLITEFSQTSNNLDDFVRFVELHLSTGRVIADESWFASGQEAVNLLTVYKAKGLEYKHVYVVDAVEDMWRPSKRGRGSPANLRLQSYGEKYDDYIRLLYVAASRAKTNFTATSFMTDEKGNEVLSTPLLSSLPTEKIDKPTSDPVKVLETGLRWPRLTSSDEKALLSERLEQYSISPTGLIDFLNIAESGPESFLERQILRIPGQRSVAGSFGTAIHAALETAQRLVNNGKLELDTVLDRYDAALESEYLVPRERSQLQKKGEKLLNHLLKQNILQLQTGALAEQNINDIQIGKARIKGKLDVIFADKQSVTITDYKTGKPLPSFTTKNQNLLLKAWRHKTQLLFYALLASESNRYKGKAISTRMVYVEADTPKQMILPLEVNPGDLHRLRQIIEKIWPRIMNLDFPDTSKYPQTYEGVVSFEQDIINGAI